MQDRKLLLTIAAFVAVVVAVGAFLAVVENPATVNGIGRAVLASTFGGALGFCTTILVAKMLAD